MPSSLIEDQNGVRARFHLGCDLGEVQAHRFGVAERQNQRRARPPLGTHGAEDIGRLGTLIVIGCRP